MQGSKEHLDIGRIMRAIEVEGDSKVFPPRGSSFNSIQYLSREHATNFLHNKLRLGNSTDSGNHPALPCPFLLPCPACSSPPRSLLLPA